MLVSRKDVIKSCVYLKSSFFEFQSKIKKQIDKTISDQYFQIKITKNTRKPEVYCVFGGGGHKIGTLIRNMLRLCLENEKLKLQNLKSKFKLEKSNSKITEIRCFYQIHYIAPFYNFAPATT